MKKHALLASAGIFSALFATAAHAEAPAVAPQAAPQAEISDGFGDAIIVTARRRAEDVSKVPVAITAFSGDQLVAKGITSTLDLSKVAPGLTISGGGTLTNPFVVIRAQSKAVTGNSSPGVITYLNDVPLPSNGSPIQTYDMQNVQVLKGPQGTLFGRNSIGGALLTVTKAPSHEFGGYVTGTMQQYDYYQVEGAVNVPIIKDKVALRLAAQVGHDGGDIKTYLYSPYSIAPVLSGGNVVGFTATPGELLAGNRNYDEYATESYRASLLIEPTDWIKNVTIGDYTKVRGTVNSTYSPGAAPGLYALDPSIINAVIGQGAPVTDPQGFFASVYSGVIIPSLAQCAANTINLPYITAGADG
ncbi:MAG: TonB-dependent receptor plug domain-containing protein, partial [Alphaproteobacteria bacterium]|nr:TonB-dependent receptor plug domain-containing protein [Alphaproteobacteria bacterium]